MSSLCDLKKAIQKLVDTFPLEIEDYEQEHEGNVEVYKLGSKSEFVTFWKQLKGLPKQLDGLVANALSLKDIEQIRAHRMFIASKGKLKVKNECDYERWVAVGGDKP